MDVDEAMEAVRRLNLKPLPDARYFELTRAVSDIAMFPNKVAAAHDLETTAVDEDGHDGDEAGAAAVAEEAGAAAGGGAATAGAGAAPPAEPTRTEVSRVRWTVRARSTTARGCIAAGVSPQATKLIALSSGARRRRRSRAAYAPLNLAARPPSKVR